jgi:hypothetical protein
MDVFEEELVALRATFPEISCPAQRLVRFPCEIFAGDAVMVSAVAMITAPLDYPIKPLLVELVDVRGAEDSYVDRTEKELTRMADELAGDAACFQLVLAVQNELELLADIIRCCICLDSVRGLGSPIFRSSSCGHCFHRGCITEYARHITQAFSESDEFAASQRAARQALSVVDTPMRRDQAAHAALDIELQVSCAQLKDFELQLSALRTRLKFEVCGTTAADVLQVEHDAAAGAVEQLTAKIRMLRRDLSAAGARASRSLAAFRAGIEISVATGAGSMKAVLPCPLCRCPIEAAQESELIRTMPVSQPFIPTTTCCTSAAGIASVVPVGLDHDTVSFLIRERSRYSAAFDRQRVNGCFVDSESPAKL